MDRTSPSEEKVALFRELFAAREDVYASRWAKQRTGKSGWGPVVVGGWANARKPGREYESFNPEVVEAHLVGAIHVGVYPLLRDDTCRLLACDFDVPGWALDALAYVTEQAERIIADAGSRLFVTDHDYVDVNIPVLARMHAKRLAAYADLGFDVGKARAGARGRRSARPGSRSTLDAPGEFRL